MDDKRIYLFDSTLRDGAQTQGVDFGVPDKQAIALALDQLGLDYIEGGWPGANPTDDAFFGAPPSLKRATFVAFGMTRRPGRSAANDPGLAALLNAKAAAVCMVGKSWDFHVDVALGISREENVAMIGESVALAKAKNREVMFDAEIVKHLGDGLLVGQREVDTGRLRTVAQRRVEQVEAVLGHDALPSGGQWSVS